MALRAAKADEAATNPDRQEGVSAALRTASGNERARVCCVITGAPCREHYAPLRQPAGTRP